MKCKYTDIFLLLLAISPYPLYAHQASVTATHHWDDCKNQGNHFNQSYCDAKEWLQKDVYVNHRFTLYCHAYFDLNNNVTLPLGFVTHAYKNRVHKMEWEHVVPAENFGRHFDEWRNGHPECINSEGSRYKGRRCAEKVNAEYRYMHADMHNLFPAIGSVNALRSNYDLTLLPDSVASSFGSCTMKIQGQKVEPPEQARGRIARTYLYMEAAYPHFSMSHQQKQLMHTWDQHYPVTLWECERANLIKMKQGNANHIVEHRCLTVEQQLTDHSNLASQ